MYLQNSSTVLKERCIHVDSFLVSSNDNPRGFLLLLPFPSHTLNHLSVENLTRLTTLVAGVRGVTVRGVVIISLPERNTLTFRHEVSRSFPDLSFILVVVVVVVVFVLCCVRAN
jgi:hypothetical protein